MKILQAILVPLLILSCNTENSNTEKTDLNNNNEVIENTNIASDNTVKEVVNDKSNIEETKEVYTYQCEDSDRATLIKFVKQYLNTKQVSLIIEAINEYPLIRTDSAMANFYFTKLDTIQGYINTSIWKYGEKNNYDNGELEIETCKIVCDCMPFLKIVFANTFDGTEAFKNNLELLKKSETTKGKGDDTFFSVMNSSVGEYHSIYNYILYDYDANYHHSWLGDGRYVSVIKEIILADQESDLFDAGLESLVAYLMSIEDEVVFGNSKQDVFKEINKLILLQDSTKFDLSCIKGLKTRLDTTTTGVYYNCANEDCS